MRRSLAIMLWILLGALAAGSSAGFFLFKANQDKLELIQEVHAARQEADDAKRLSERLMNEANQKLTQAKQVEASSQNLIQRYQEWQALLTSAKPLAKPSVATLKTWGELVSVPLKLSVRVPPKQDAWETDKGLVMSTKSVNTNIPAEQWLSIFPNKTTDADALEQRLTNRQPVAWQVGQYILKGSRGQWDNLSGSTYVLKVMNASTSTQVIWARTTKEVNEQRLMDTLSTLVFAP